MTQSYKYRGKNTNISQTENILNIILNIFNLITHHKNNFMVLWLGNKDIFLSFIVSSVRPAPQHRLKWKAWFTAQYDGDKLAAGSAFRLLFSSFVLRAELCFVNHMNYYVYIELSVDHVVVFVACSEEWAELCLIQVATQNGATQRQSLINDGKHHQWFLSMECLLFFQNRTPKFSRTIPNKTKFLFRVYRKY